MRNRRIIISCTLVLLGVLISSCGPRIKEPEVPPIMSSELLSRLPLSTFGFFIWRASLLNPVEGSQNPPEYRSPVTLSVFERLLFLLAPAGNYAERISSFVDIVRKTGLIPGTLDDPSPVKNGVIFLATQREFAKVFLGILLVSDGQTNLQDKLAALESVLSSFDFSTNIESYGSLGRNGFSVDLLPSAPESAPLKRLYFAADKGLLAVSSSRAELSPLFGLRTGRPFMETLALNEGFAHLRDTVEKLTPLNRLGFLSFTPFIENSGGAARSTPSVTDANPASRFPIESIAVGTDMNTQRLSSMVLALKPRSQEQERWIDALKAPGLEQPLSNTHVGSVWLARASGGLIQRGVQTVLNELPAERHALLTERLEPFLASSRLTLGMLAAKPPSGVSHFYMLIERIAGKDSDITALREIFSVVGGTERENLQWKERVIDGVNTSVWGSQTGISFLLGAQKNAIIAATSEEAFKAGASSLRSAQGISCKLSETADKAVRESAPFFILFGERDFLSKTIGSAYMDNLSSGASFLREVFDGGALSLSKNFLTAATVDKDLIVVSSFPCESN